MKVLCVLLRIAMFDRGIYPLIKLDPSRGG